MDFLLAGTQFSLSMEFLMPGNCPAWLTSYCGSPVENIPLQAERHSGRRQKLFAFPTELRSPSDRNAVRIHNGMVFGFRPESRSPSTGFPNVIQSIPLEEKRFGFEPEVTVKIAKLGLRVYEVGISYWGRTYEEGKKIGWKDGFRALWCLIKYSWKEGKMLPVQDVECQLVNRTPEQSEASALR
jgi:hypothetical protein